MMVGMESSLISTAEVARQLGVNRKTVQRMVQRGDLVPDHRTPIGPLFDQVTVDAARAAPVS